MARQKLLDRAINALAGKPSSDTIRRRLEDAEAKVRDAEHVWRTAALAVEAGGNPADETAAENALTQARREVTRLQAILQEVETRNAAEANAEQLAREVAEDAILAKACGAYVKAAHSLAPALAAYVAGYRSLADAGEQVRSLAEISPRARHDLRPPNVETLVAVELTRLAAGGVLPPGASRWAAATDTRQIVALADQLDGLATAIRASLRHE